MDVRRTTLSALTAITLATTVGCTSMSRDAEPASMAPTTQPNRASMLAADGIGAAAFADDTAIAGAFRPYAGRIDGPAQAAFIFHADESAYAGVRTD